LVDLALTSIVTKKIKRMSKPQLPKKPATIPAAPQARAPQAAVPTRGPAPAVRKEVRQHEELTFARQNYLIMLGGLGFITLGLLLMLGGRMPDNNTWAPEVIYSARRITIAPMAMLVGFGVILYGIFYDAQPKSVVQTNVKNHTEDTPDA
jgi:Protein of unknown function (DUF3098)